MLKTEQVVNKIIEALEDNKAHRIVKIDLRKIENCFCSFFVICHGTSGTHIAGLTDAVEEKVREDLDETSRTDTLYASRSCLCGEHGYSRFRIRWFQKTI